MADFTELRTQTPAALSAELARQRKREYDRKRYVQNREQILARLKLYRQENGDAVRERDRQRYLACPEKYRLKNRKSAKKHRAKNTAREQAWRKQNKDRVRGHYRKHVKKKLSKNALFRLQQNIRTRMCSALSKSGAKKGFRTLMLVGCTAAELRKYIESKFLPGMTWENRGRHGWHIDHIIPLAKFDLRDPEQQAAAFHYTNLQPLWAEDNLRKSDKLRGQNLFGFAYADRIAVGEKPRRSGHRKHGTRQHVNDKHRSV